MSIKIGLFDSGIGGLSLLTECASKFSMAKVNAEFVYLADHFMIPYGTKSAQIIKERCYKLTKYLVEQEKVSLILVSCHTATLIAIDDLRELFPNTPFVGVEPYYKYLLEHPHKKMGILLTEMSANSVKFQKMQELFDPDKKVPSFPLKNLAYLIEKLYLCENQDKKKNLFNKIAIEVEPIRYFIKKEGIQTLILACTHYPLIMDELTVLLKDCEFIYPASSIVEQLIHLLTGQKFTPKKVGPNSPTPLHFYSSHKRWAKRPSSPIANLLAPHFSLQNWDHLTL